MSAVSLIDYIPLARYDGIKWTKALIQECATPSTNDADWTTLSTVIFSDPDVDPRYPKPRSFTVEGTLSSGWYRVVFVDSLNQDHLPTTPVHNIPEVTVPYQPLVGDVANLILSRTKDSSGNELGTFSDTTRPTHEKVEEIIQQAADDVTTVIDTDIPESAYEYVEQAIALRAAMIIERSYYSEQINSNRSPYPQLKDDYEYLTGTIDKPGLITRAVERESEEAIRGEAQLTNRPSYSFPDPDLRYKLGRPL